MTNTTLPTHSDLEAALADFANYTVPVRYWTDYMGDEHAQLSFTWQRSEIERMIDHLAARGIVGRFGTGYTVSVSVDDNPHGECRTFTDEYGDGMCGGCGETEHEGAHR